jgi:tetratricopeptide (TPR) repeat protein
MLRAVKFTIFLTFAALPLGTIAQTDELRAATGIPIQIGQPVIYGKVTLRGLSKEDKKPIVHVSLLEGASQLGRVQTNDAGYYYFLRSPRGGLSTLVFEINNNEVGRMVLNAPPDTATRALKQDVEFDWEEFKQRSAAGVVVVEYPRGAEQAKLFDAAMQHVTEKNFNKAISILDSLLAKDPKDYIAWTEMGTIYFKTNALDNAEACYFKAIELKKDYFLALLNLGKLYITKRQADNAILVLTNAVKSRSASADAYYYLGEAYLLAKKGSLAVPALNEAIRLAPMEMADVHLRLASLYDAAGAKSRASAEYKLFLSKRPNHPEKAQYEKYISANPPQ